MDQIFKLILIYLLFRASFLFFLRFYFYSIFAECRGGGDGKLIIKNSIKYLFSFDAYKLQDRDVSVPKLGTFAFQAQCFQIKELSDPRKTL